MTDSPMADVFWVVGCVVQAALAAALYTKRVYRTAPRFCVWILLTLFTALSLFAVSRCGGSHSYAVVYYTSAAADSALEVALIMEFAAQSLRQQGRWMTGTKRTLQVASLLAVLLAATLSLRSQPSTHSALDSIFVRSTLFVSMLVFLLSLEVLFFSYESGCIWKLSEMHRFGGFVVWSAMCALTDTLHIYNGNTINFEFLETFRSCTSLAVTVYWLATTLLPEKTHVGGDIGNRLQDMYSQHSRSVR